MAKKVILTITFFKSLFKDMLQRENEKLCHYLQLFKLYQYFLCGFVRILFLFTFIKLVERV